MYNVIESSIIYNKHKNIETTGKMLSKLWYVSGAVDHQAETVITLLRNFRRGKCSGYKFKLKKVVSRAFCKIIDIIIHERLKVNVSEWLIFEWCDYQLFFLQFLYFLERALLFIQSKSYFQKNTVWAVLWPVIRFQSVSHYALVNQFKNHRNISKS